MVAIPVTVPQSTPRNKSHCPRCEDMLVLTYDEPVCLSCGYHDYQSAPPTYFGRNRSLLSSATKFVVRYAGDAPSLMDVTTRVQAIRVGNRLAHEVQCPFCPDRKIMEQSSLSGKRREVREERFRCEDSHRVSLTPDRSGNLAWK